MNDELEGIGKEAVADQLEAVTRASRPKDVKRCSRQDE
jgi:hypothetical protein